MEKLAGLDFDTADIESYAQRNCKKKGFITKQPTEEYVISEPFLYPFREVHFFGESNRLLASSLLDEYLFSSVTDNNEWLLLWRPRYTEAAVEEVNLVSTDSLPIAEEDAICDFVGKMLDSRTSQQQELETVNKKIRESNSLFRSAASLFLPRSPTTIRQQETMTQEKTSVDAWVKATSIVLNLSPSEKPTRVEVGSRLFAKMVVILYKSIETKQKRPLVLESPLSGTLNDTRKSGRPMSRLLSLNQICFRLIFQKFL